jgi:hypothetical protein
MNSGFFHIIRMLKSRAIIVASSSIQLRAARALIESYAGVSQRQAANNNYLNRSYVQRRVQGQRTRELANADQQILSGNQETFLVNCAIAQCKLGYAARVTYFKHFAERLLIVNRTPHRLEKRWHYRFLKRNTEVRTLKSTLIDYKRANGALTENINIFFNRLDDSILAAIPPEHFYNADEFGLFQEVEDNSLRIKKAYRKQVKVKNAHNLQ